MYYCEAVSTTQNRKSKLLDSLYIGFLFFAKSKPKRAYIHNICLKDHMCIKYGLERDILSLNVFHLLGERIRRGFFSFSLPFFLPPSFPSFLPPFLSFSFLPSFLPPSFSSYFLPSFFIHSPVFLRFFSLSKYHFQNLKCQ